MCAIWSHYVYCRCRFICADMSKCICLCLNSYLFVCMWGRKEPVFTGMCTQTVCMCVCLCLSSFLLARCCVYAATVFRLPEPIPNWQKQMGLFFSSSHLGLEQGVCSTAETYTCVIALLYYYKILDHEGSYSYESMQCIHKIVLQKPTYSIVHKYYNLTVKRLSFYT